MTIRQKRHIQWQIPESCVLEGKYSRKERLEQN